MIITLRSSLRRIGTAVLIFVGAIVILAGIVNILAYLNTAEIYSSVHDNPSIIIILYFLSFLAVGGALTGAGIYLNKKKRNTRKI